MPSLCYLGNCKRIKNLVGGGVVEFLSWVNFVVKEKHIGSTVSEILWHIETHPDIFFI